MIDISRCVIGDQMVYEDGSVAAYGALFAKYTNIKHVMRRGKIIMTNVKPDPLIFGASTPGCEAVPGQDVPEQDKYVPLTSDECIEIAYSSGGVWRTTVDLIRAAHRIGWERRRTP